MTEYKARLGDRSLFPKLKYRVYANHAGISAPSIAVSHAAQSVYQDYEERGVSAFLNWLLQRNRLKEKFATLVGATAQEIGLTQNTTRGVIDIALCFPWNQGDRVIVFKGEFPANVTPWQRAAELFGLQVVYLNTADYLTDVNSALTTLTAELKRGARLVAVSAVEFQTGFQMPIAQMAALCHEHGAQLFVDAVQACGIVPLSASEQGFDYLACGSHKWLMGVEGCGFLYAQKDRAAELKPNVAGWLSHEDGLGFLLQGEGLLRYDRPLKKSIELIEGGNTNAAGFAALEASIDLIQSLGVSTILEHVQAYHDRLEPHLLDRGFTSYRSKNPAHRSGSLCVKPPPGISVVDLQHALSNAGISTAIPDGVLRFSPHWPNSHAEVEIIVTEIDAYLTRAPRS
ncbi:MAG: aminotransferase class V-fold PLP-dependent enzyme [Polyangiaceae bacterium]|nr:aminotransferase class V-fold PLP-dependent enzyme [Polyangiaceae bacterium]